MKKLLIFAIVALLSVGVASAEEKQAPAKTKAKTECCQKGTKKAECKDAKAECKDAKAECKEVKKCDQAKPCGKTDKKDCCKETGKDCCKDGTKPCCQKKEKK